MSAKPKRKNPRLSIHGPTPAERKWTRIIEKWRQTGLHGTDFCRKGGHSISAFTFWKKEIRDRQERRKSREEKPSKQKPPMRFLPARVVGKETTAPKREPLEVVVSGGRSLRVAGDFDSALLQKLLATLEARP